MGVKNLLNEAMNAHEKQGRSKLEPYSEAIFTLRKKRWTFKEIAKFLEQKAGVKVDPSTIWDFIKVRSKRFPQKQAESPIEQPAAPTTGQTSNKPAVFVPRQQKGGKFNEAHLKTNDMVEE